MFLSQGVRGLQSGLFSGAVPGSSLFYQYKMLNENEEASIT